jgi:glycosyltransferase involved in cell wall biosynthesis
LPAPQSPILADESTALVHDYLLVMRGAERTFAAMAELWPGSPIYTLLYDEAGTWSRFAGRAVSTSWLQSLGVKQRGFRRLLPLFPLAARRLPVGDAQLVVSSSSAFAHGVKVAPGATHVCYCHTPFRYGWHEQQRALQEVRSSLRPAMRLGLRWMRSWDRRCASAVTHYIANSEITRRRIQEFWNRDASVIHPPVEVERFELGDPEDFFLVVSELVPHKRVDVALEAARRAGRDIRVVGTGPDLSRLRREYAGKAEFLGRVSDRELADLYGRSLALVVPNVEEFGIASVEAQAAGRPVIAIGAGGARETVRDGVTGVLVPLPGPEALAEALRYTDFSSFSRQRIQSHARTFSGTAFKRKFRAEVLRVVGAPAEASKADAASASASQPLTKPA